jgi:hypothetical protein
VLSDVEIFHGFKREDAKQNYKEGIIQGTTF